MSENNNEQFKMPPKRPRGPMGHGPGMVTEKARDFKGSTKKLIKYLGRYWAAIIAVMIFAAVSTVFSVAGPKIMGKATTALAEGLMNKIAGTGGIDFDYIAKVLLFTLALYVVSAIFMFAQGLIMTGITQKTCYRMRKDITSKINRMPMKYFAYHKRCGHTRTELEPEYHTDYYICCHFGRYTGHDAVYFTSHDADFTRYPACFDDTHFVCHKAFTEILQTAAGVSGTYQRTGRGGVRRSPCHKGI